MRVIEIRLSGDKDNCDSGDLDENDEAMEQRCREEDERHERFAAQERLEVAGYNAKPDELLPVIDEQLATFGLEIVQFDDGRDDYMWRIEKRGS